MIKVDGLTINLPGFEMRDIAFHVPAGHYGILMGTTGSGKTTVLEAICGLRKPKSGMITIAGHDVTRAKPGERGIGYVPQDGALFPTMKIADQIGFALELRKTPYEHRRSRVEELAELLSISHLLQRNPQGLSGGERQRVSLGRALAHNPEVLLLDEPISALDEDTRGRMMKLLKRVQQHEQVTVLHVTHNISEAQQLGTHLLRLTDGNVIHEPSNIPSEPQP